MTIIKIKIQLIIMNKSKGKIKNKVAVLETIFAPTGTRTHNTSIHCRVFNPVYLITELIIVPNWVSNGLVHQRRSTWSGDLSSNYAVNAFQMAKQYCVSLVIITTKCGSSFFVISCQNRTKNNAILQLQLLRFESYPWPSLKSK